MSREHDHDEAAPYSRIEPQGCPECNCVLNFDGCCDDCGFGYEDQPNMMEMTA